MGQPEPSGDAVAPHTPTPAKPNPPRRGSAWAVTKQSKKGLRSFSFIHAVIFCVDQRCRAFEIQACVLVSNVGIGLVKQEFKESPSILREIKSAIWWPMRGAHPKQ